MHRKSNKHTAKRKQATAHASAVAVMEFLNGPAPDFLSAIVQETIDRACEHLDPHNPFYVTHEPEHEKQDMDLLTAMCRRTRMLSLDDMENTSAGLARRIRAVYRHPLTPVKLYDSIGNFVTDGTNLEVSACELDTDGGDTNLIGEWTWRPETIQRVIELSNTYDK
ncbi:MAG: hypothetical protein ABJB61_06515 [bacterium]